MRVCDPVGVERVFTPLEAEDRWVLRDCSTELPDAQECDATNDDSTNTVGYKKVRL